MACALLLLLLSVCVCVLCRNIFFILANLAQILFIFLDRRAVSLSDEERGLYELVFGEVFSQQEFVKLLKVGQWRDVQAGEELMTQGKEIQSVYLIADGLCRVEEERRILIAREEGSTRSSAGPAAPTSPSLLSKLFGSARDSGAQGMKETAPPPAQPALAPRPASTPAPSARQGVDSDEAEALLAATGISSSVSPSAVPSIPSASVAPASLPSSSPSEPVLSAVAQQVADNVRELIHGLHSKQQPHAEANHSVTTTPAPSAQATPALPYTSSASLSAPSSLPPPPHIAVTGVTVQSAASSPPSNDEATSSSAAPSSSLPSPPIPTSASPPPMSDERERRKAERKAKRDRKRRERPSSVDRQFGVGRDEAAAAAALTSSPTLSHDGLYEVRKEVIGYMRGGRMVGEMSLLTTAASTQPAPQLSQPTAAPPSTSSVADCSSPSPSIPSPSAAASAAAASPADYLAPSFIASASPSIATATVRCVEPCRVLMWSRDSLRSLFFRFPTLSVGWYAVVSTDLVHRLSESQHLARRNGYKLLLLGICAEGTVTAKQRSAAEEYRRINSIRDEEHYQTLRDLGWTEQEWDRGRKRTGWMERWL